MATNDPWPEWNGEYYITHYLYVPSGANQRIVVQPSAEEIEHQKRVAAEAEARRIEAKRIADEIEARAEAILKQALDEIQLKEFEKDRTFRVISKDGQRHYRIHKGRAQNIDRLDPTGKRTHVLCAHPVENVPHYDNMLAQKLFLEHAEEEFLRIANERPA